MENSFARTKLSVLRKAKYFLGCREFFKIVLCLVLLLQILACAMARQPSFDLVKSDSGVVELKRGRFVLRAYVAVSTDAPGSRLPVAGCHSENCNNHSLTLTAANRVCA